MNYESFWKRLFDLVFSIAGFLLISPFLLIVAILIKLDSKGPVFFFQQRMGKDGRIFRLIKFRSMYVDPQKEKQGFTPGDSSRITRIGRIIRKTKIDELPELINVIKGDMSLVGPRPEVPKYRSFYSGKYREILKLRPGITDLASIKYKNEEEILKKSNDPEKTYTEVILPDKLELALEYKKKMSFSTDLKMIFGTILRLFT